VRHLIRRFVRSYPVTFKTWLRVTNGYPVKLPSVDTDLHVDGFQRSGNTFASLVLRDLFPDKAIATNLHAVAAIKQALDFEVPTIILLRDPEEAILSSIVRRVDGQREQLSAALSLDLHGYLDYYSYANERRDDLSFVVFDEMIRDATALVSAASAAFCVAVPARASIVKSSRQALATLESDKREGGDRNLYSEHKEKLKDRYRSRLDRDLLTQCKALYEQLAERSA